MAFLDNSGDIILDAVLTDTGRFRMARGDFRISKFALVMMKLSWVIKLLLNIRMESLVVY